MEREWLKERTTKIKENFFKKCNDSGSKKIIKNSGFANFLKKNSRNDLIFILTYMVHVVSFGIKNEQKQFICKICIPFYMMFM